jgi:hypothetical protein
MERLQSEFERKKTDIFSDNTHRMPERPFFIQSGKGRGHEDLGSSFAPSQPVQGKATGRKVKPAAATSRPITTSLEEDSFSDSDDELLLSEGAQPLDLLPITPKRVVRGKTIVSMPQKANLAPNGHLYHKDFPPKGKLPNFKRIEKQLQVEESVSDCPPSSSLPDADDSQELCRLTPKTKPSQSATKPKKDKDTVFARPGPGRNSVSRKIVIASSTSGGKLLKHPERVPGIRAAKAGGSIVRGRSPEAIPRASRQPRPFPLSSHPSVYDGSSRASDPSPPRKNTQEPSTKKEKTNALSRGPVAPFPMSPLGKLNFSKQTLPELTGPSSFPSTLHTPKPGLTRSETLENFPVPSPLASPVQPLSRDKGKSRALAPHQDDDDGELAINYCGIVRTNVALSVNSSEINTSHRRSPQSSSESMTPKRASGGGDGQRGRKAKRHKEDNSR